VSCDPHDGCITCGDIAVEMRVVRVDEERDLALCTDPSGAHSAVEIALVKPVGAGDAVLVHAGTAIGKAAEHHPATPGRDAGEVAGL
jgi:hydrogenase maturation factor